MKVTDNTYDCLLEIENGDLSRHTVMTFLDGLNNQTAYTRAYGYRDGKAQQKALLKRFWTVLENKLKEHK